MKTLPLIAISLIIGFAAGFYYVAIQNTYRVAYGDGAVEAMTKVCPALTDKFKAPLPK